MNTPKAGTTAADARRVAAARAARAAAASRRAAAAKRRLLLLSVLGGFTVIGWVLTATISFTWIAPAVLTLLTVAVAEMGRRAAAAGVAADHKLAEQVRLAEAQAGIRVALPAVEESNPVREKGNPVDVAEETQSSHDHTAPQRSSSLRVDVDPAKSEDNSWTPVPVPPPAYTLKATVRRKVTEFDEVNEHHAHTPETTVETSDAEDAAGQGAPALEDAAGQGAPAVAETGGESLTSASSQGVNESAVAESAEATAVESENEEHTGAGLNVQEILARRRAVG